jgi:hypothetical protein
MLRRAGLNDSELDAYRWQRAGEAAHMQHPPVTVHESVHTLANYLCSARGMDYENALYALNRPDVRPLPSQAPSGFGAVMYRPPM